MATILHPNETQMALIGIEQNGLSSLRTEFSLRGLSDLCGDLKALEAPKEDKRSNIFGY